MSPQPFRESLVATRFDSLGVPDVQVGVREGEGELPMCVSAEVVSEYQLCGPLLRPSWTMKTSAGLRRRGLAYQRFRVEDCRVAPDKRRSDSGAFAPGYQLGGEGPDHGNRGLLPLSTRVSLQLCPCPSRDDTTGRWTVPRPVCRGVWSWKSFINAAQVSMCRSVTPRCAFGARGDTRVATSSRSPRSVRSPRTFCAFATG